MKKQVKFAEVETVHWLHEDEPRSRTSGTNESMTALKDAALNFNSGLKVNRPPAARCQAQQHGTTAQIPKAVSSGPFLKHAALTPAQKEYLYAVAASHSAVHVRHLITQHYLNVLHRCTHTVEAKALREATLLCPLSSHEGGGHRSKVSHQEKTNAGARNPGKSFLPKIPNRHGRLSNTSASKQTKVKKPGTTTTTSPTLTRKSPRSQRD